MGITYAQNSHQERILSETVETIVINGNQIFKIDVATHDLPEIVLKSQIDGEYQDMFQITYSVKGPILTFQLEESPLISIPDDKRNAHKVVAATLSLSVPRGKNLDIVSDIASVDVKGLYNHLTVQLLEGFCEIHGHAEKAIINTVDGNIEIKTTSGKVFASSRYGDLNLDSLKLKNGKWQLQSIRGDITILKGD